MIEKFQPTTAQLTRLSQEAYAEFEAISLAKLRQIEAASPIDLETESKESESLKLRAQAELQLQQPIDDFLSGGTLATLEETIGDTVSTGLLLAMLLAVGGVDRLRQSRFLRDTVLDTRRLIQGNLRATQRNADRIAEGELTEGQIKDQARRRSLGIRSGFSSASLLDRMVSRFHNEGIRRLTSAHPCPDCPQYQRLNYVPLEEIVPIATFCACGSNCKCQIQSRFNPARALQDLVSGNLIDRVQRRDEFMRNTENAYLARHGWL